MTLRAALLLTSVVLSHPFVSLAQRDTLPDCEWCGATEAPEELSWKAVIPDETEPGSWMKISGHVFKSDGKTPAAQVILYVYHTNAKGIYEKRGNETGNGKRHGYLRAWMKTNDYGDYEFTTIKPEPYPNRRSPAHVHITVLEPGKEEYWIDSFKFEGDPLLTEKDKKESGIVRLAKGDGGMLVGTRDIVLPER